MGLLRRVGRTVLVWLDRLWDAIIARWRGDRPLRHLRVLAYRGHGTPNEVVVRGRALNDPPPSPVVAGESAWRSARRMLRWFESDEVRGVPLEVVAGTASVEVITDREGYFRATLTPGWDEATGGWQGGRVRLAEPFRGVTELAAEAEVLVPPPTATFGVISDMDDTVLQTGAQRVVEMVRTTVFGSSKSREPFPGVSELYQALAAGSEGDARNPVFYVSKSPWNLYEFLVDFLDYRGIPRGPLLLRDLGVHEPRSVSTGRKPHKRAMIDEVLTAHPDLDFVLIGDSGEHDPELYADTIASYPGRIRAAYIRDVAPAARSNEVRALAQRVTASGVPMVLAADSLAVAEHAAAEALVARDAVARVAHAVAAET